MLKAGLAFLGVVVVLSLSPIAWAADTFTESGVVKELRSGSVVLETREGLKEFKRDLLTEALPKNVKVGDRVTLTYTLHAKEVRKPGQAQQPGQKPGLPGIVDDRAYYPA